MTALLGVGSYLPPRSVPVAQYFADIGAAEDPAVYERYYGYSRIRRDPGGNLADQLCAAAANLAELRGREAHVRYLVYAPTIQLTAPYPRNPLHAVRRALGLDRALPFSLTQHACASALLAVDACGRLLASDGDPDAVALVLAGEKTFTRDAQIVPHAAVMGEGIAAVLVAADGPRDRVLAYAVRTLGEFHEAPELTPELDAAFQAGYIAVLVEVIRAAVIDAGLAMADVAFILPHNVNRMSWLRVMLQLGLPKERLFLDHQADLGHCFGADSFLALAAVSRGGRLRPGDRYVMTAAGLGATLSAMVFEH